jgi:hypothetical protein
LDKSGAIAFCFFGKNCDQILSTIFCKKPDLSWLVEFKDGIKVSIIAPKAPEPGYHNHTVQQAADAASYLPKANRSVIKTILLNAVVNPDDAYWAGEYHLPDFHST